MMKESKDSSKPASSPVVKEQTGFYDIPERYEIIEGVRYDFLSSPKITHQALLGQLHMSLNTSCHADGVILLAPMDVHLSKDNIVQPDLIFIASDNLSIMKNEKIMGPPSLLVEILSPSTGSRDKVLKKKLYSRFGISEYWIIDPVHSAVDQFVLAGEGDGYALAASYDETDTLTSMRYPCMSVSLSELFGVLVRFKSLED
ncbi:MAG: hypothetical protein K0R67_1275 [Paenibacillus sp.]|jgi:Uma2 family endonuclease|nr:hypothetical protein [Paenibacillus sp.]